MAKFAWRLQGDIAKGEKDPLMTVFMGVERAIVDDDGNPTSETFIEQDTSDPVQMPLSELSKALAHPEILEKARKDAKKSAPNPGQYAGLAGVSRQPSGS